MRKDAQNSITFRRWLLFVGVFALPCPVPAARAQTAQKRLTEANLPEVVFINSVYGRVAHHLTIAAAKPETQLPKQEVVTSTGRRFSAYTGFQPDPKSAAPYRYPFHIFFTDFGTQHTYEICGLPEPHRPYSYLLFTGGNILQFDRWASPHHGIRYRFDVRRRKLISARAFIEADYITLMKKTQKEQSQRH